MKSLLTLLVGYMLSCLVATTSLAAEGFAELGTIDAVKLSEKYIIVDDGLYALAPDIVVFSQSGEAVSLDTLRHGMSVAFNAVSLKGKAGTITELLILNSKPKSKPRRK